MNDIRINNQQIELLRELKENIVSIIWDINAFYFNSDTSTYKLECFVNKPIGSDFEYDEIFHCEFTKQKQIQFEANNSAFWYKIIDSETQIISIKVIDIIQEFPSDILLNHENEATEKNGINKLTVGLILETGRGFIPAFLLPSNYGFDWHGKYEFYEKEEVTKLLNEELEKYQIRIV